MHGKTQKNYSQARMSFEQGFQYRRFETFSTYKLFEQAGIPALKYTNKF
jgi:hypothetical protein